MARVGVILSGCGFQDGAEIHEAVLSLLFLDRAGHTITAMAPDIAQTKVSNHLTGEAVKESRNVLVEAARIARGKIRDISRVTIDDLDALVMPGGFGAALNLSNFAVKGPGSTVNKDVERLIYACHTAKKPIVAICIAPAVVARVLGQAGVGVTIGNDADTAGAIEVCGARHFDRKVTEVYVDEINRVITTPAYMYNARICDVATGVEAAIGKLNGWLGK